MTLRTTILLAIAAIAISCASCKYDYTCQCKIKYTGQPGLPDSTIREYPITDKKDKAKSICEQNSVHKTDESTGIKTDEDCKLF